MMRRLLWFAFIGFVAWYGWNHRDDLRGNPTDGIVAINRSGNAIERLRIGVGDDDVVVFEVLEDGAEQRRPWQGHARGVFVAQWTQRGRIGEREWRGNAFEPSGTLFEHRFEFQPDGRVLMRSERRAAAR